MASVHVKVCKIIFRSTTLTLNLLTWTKWWPPANDSKWRVGFNSAFKGLNQQKYKIFP